MCAAVVGVLVLNASASFFFFFSPLMRGLVLGKHTERFSALRVYVSYRLIEIENSLAECITSTKPIAALSYCCCCYVGSSSCGSFYRQVRVRVPTTLLPMAVI